MKVKFNERLAEMMFYADNMTSDSLGKAIGVGGSTVRLWKQGKRSPFLSNAIKLANYFQCSLDFLFGRSETMLDFAIRQPVPIFERLLTILSERGISRYKMIKDTKLSKRNLESWRDGRDLMMQMLIDIADYLGITLDYLVGRDR